jgi:hypothetical protein
VVDSVPGPGQDSAGRLAQGYTVHIRTGLGQTGALFVATENYTVEALRPKLAELARTLDAVKAMSG